MRIVDVCAFYSPWGGGVKTYVEQKLAIGPRLGHEIIILAPGDDHGVIDCGQNARIVTIPSPRLPVDRKYWYFDDEPALHASLDSLKPDFVEVSSPWRSPSMLGRWNADVPRSLIMHADPLSAYAYRWLEPLFRRETIDRRFERFWAHLRNLSQSVDQVVCASNSLRERLRSGGVANTITLPMGIEARLFSPALRDEQLRTSLLAECGLPPTANLLIAAGRLAPEKRWPMIIDAVTAASHTLPVGLIILGEGSQARRILGSISGNPHIRLLGPERDRRRFATTLASADALIHGCEAETFCMVGAEARASGLPVIVPDEGGAADHARSGGGITYKAGSALAAAQAIQHHFSQTPAFSSIASNPITMEDHFAKLFSGYANLIRCRHRAA